MKYQVVNRYDELRLQGSDIFPRAEVARERLKGQEGVQLVAVRSGHTPSPCGGLPSGSRSCFCVAIIRKTPTLSSACRFRNQRLALFCLTGTAHSTSILDRNPLRTGRQVPRRTVRDAPHPIRPSSQRRLAAAQRRICCSIERNPPSHSPTDLRLTLFPRALIPAIPTRANTTSFPPIDTTSLRAEEEMNSTSELANSTIPNHSSANHQQYFAPPPTHLQQHHHNVASGQGDQRMSTGKDCGT